MFTNWNQSARVRKEAGKSGNRNTKIGQGPEKSRIKVGQEWEHSGNKARGKNGNIVGTRMGTKWEQSGNKNPKLGQEWE